MSLFRKIFGGGPPEEFVALTTDPSTLFHGEGIPMTGRVEHIKSPNRRANKAISAHRGRIVISRDQLVVYGGRWLRCHATFTDDESAPITLMVRGDGVTVDLDVAKALPPNGAGTAQLSIRTHIPQTVLAQLPSHNLKATAPEADILSMTRWT